MRLKELYESMGEAKFAMTMVNLINEGKISEKDFSFKGLWEAMGCPSFGRERAIATQAVTEAEFTEAMDSSAFPKMIGAVINKKVQEAYDLEYGIADQLVTVFPSSQRDETIVGFADDDELREVGEGMEYQEGSVTEKHHKIKNRKFGRVIGVTMEHIKFDQTGMILEKARRLGEMAKVKHEQIIMEAVLENASTGDYASWRPAGNPTTLYDNSSNDPFSSGTLDNYSTNTLADETDIDEAMQLWGAMTDEQGLPIHITPKILLTGVGYRGIAASITQSGQNITKTAPPGIKNIYSGAIMPLASAHVDNIVGTKYWLIGDFKKQFVYTEVFPLQTMQAKAGNEQEFERDVMFRYKARLMGGCGALTNRYVIFSTGAS